MPNVVITDTTNTIRVDFGDYASATGFKKGSWPKDKIEHFKLDSDDEYVFALTQLDPRWALSFNGSTGTFQVDSVNGVAPTSNSDLYDKLIALLG